MGLVGGTAVLGATGNGQAAWSAATIFSRGGEGWQEQQKLIVAANGEVGDEFGLAIALPGGS